MTSSPGRISARIAAISSAPVREWVSSVFRQPVRRSSQVLATLGEAALPGQLTFGMGLGDVQELLASEKGFIEGDRLHKLLPASNRRQPTDGSTTHPASISNHKGAKEL